jgi:uncharacterized protein YxeA
MITDSQVEQVHKDMWAEVIEQYGTASSVPDNESQRISDHVRGMYVLQVWQQNGSVGSGLKFMRSYSLPEEVMLQLAEKYCGVESIDEAQAELVVEKRANKWGAFLSWAKTQVFEQFTTEQLCEKSGFSYQTTLKYLQTSPSFRKIQKGVWEVRDPKADREAEKN